MSFQVATTAITSFQNNMELAVQQKTTKLAGYAASQPGSGELQELVNLVGSVLPNEPSSRFSDTQLNDVSHTRRWCPKPQAPFTFAEFVDTQDKLAAGIDLQGAYTMQGSAVMARSADIAFLRGFYGTAFTGKLGGTQVAFPAGNIGAVSLGAAGPTGMNIAKLRWAIRTMMAGLVDMDEEEFFCALTSVQYDNLMSELQATSFDFIGPKEKGVLESGKLPMLFNTHFILCEYGNTTSFGAAAALTLDSNSYRRVPFWAKSGMKMVEWSGVITDIGPRRDKNNAMQVYAERTLAGARTQEAKCLQLLCLEV